MDAILSAALEEICSRGTSGTPLPLLWPSLNTFLASSGLPASLAVKRALWGRLLTLPSIRFIGPDGVVLGPQDPRIRPVEEAERLGVSIVAEEGLRDNFMGLYERNASGSEISQPQRRALELLAAARTSGITQAGLAKELGVESRNLFYIVRNLECQQLIVRQSTIVRAKESGMDGENELKSPSAVNTNLIQLYRYAKSMSLNSQQRIEITRPDLLGSLGEADGSSLVGDGASREDVCIKDFLPAMRAVCDKLEEANQKVLVVSDIKVALGYRKKNGHRAWRNILNRLKDASLVEEVQANINNKVVNCLHLLKKFDPKDFQPKTITGSYDGFDSEQVVKHGKRGQITSQYFELPIDQRMYDMIDGEGSRGITIPEICKRLGLSAKRMYATIIAMCSRFGMHMKSEGHNRTTVYRLWTSRNYQQPVKNELSTKSRDLLAYDQACQDIQVLDPRDDTSHSEAIHNGQIRLETPSTNSIHSGKDDAQVILSGITPHNLMSEFTNVGDDARLTGSSILLSPEALSILSKNKALKSHRRHYPTDVGERREQRILERLKNDKFILAAELHKWLEGLEKDKPTMTARKTLNRTLNKLQQEGLCKSIQVSIPVVTNYTRTRPTEVILHPSIGTLSSELLDQIYKRQRQFDIQSRGGSSKSTNDRSVTLLTGVKQSSSRVVDKPVFLEAMRANGFVPAKMVRVKLLHYFLWGYLSNLPDWHNALNSKHSLSTRHLFALGEAMKAMPLELFLQVVGSTKVIDGMVEHCRLGLRLRDLPTQEYKCLMDTYATGRLSSIIDILLRLKLIQLMSEGLPEDANVLPHAVLTHAMELKPYIEEPLPRAISSSNANSSDSHPRIRHDFVLLKQDAVDAYWETLEYCYAAADPTVAFNAFPGSAVPEVFHSRSWTSVRLMTAEQRTKLLKRIGDDRPKKKLLFKECVDIAKELSLTVEQVIRFYYDTRRSLSRTYYRSPKRKERKNHTVTRKRTRGSLKNSKLDNEARESSEPVMSASDADEQHIGKTSSAQTCMKNHDSHLQACEDDDCVNAEVDFISPISQCAFPTPRLTRRKRFPWTDSTDRQLVMQYARYRASMGPRFYRVDWNSLSDIPSCPNTCRRRMTLLNSNVNIRKAVMKLCNLLGERYTRYLAETSKAQTKYASPNGNLVRNLSATQEKTATSISPLFCWDDFEDPEIETAVNEVLRYKSMAKLEYPKRFVARDGKEWTDIIPADGTNSDAEECVTPMEEDVGARGPEDASTRSKSSFHQRQKKLLKFLNRKRGSTRSPVSESLAVANAIELLKLVFLSTSSEPEVQAKLATLLRLYSEYDLFEAFNYLREKSFMVVGHGSRPYVLSQKFWHNASSSPFPIDSGKRAANFSSWLHEQQKELKSNCVGLTSDLQCGEIFHLFALLSMGELLISPCLPKEGIGEADEPRSSKSFLSGEYIGDTPEPKSLKRKSEEGQLSRGEKEKKQRPQGRIDTDFCSRREKGFPGIKVLLNRSEIVRDSAVQFTTHEKNVDISLSYAKKTPSLSSNLNTCQNLMSHKNPKKLSPCDSTALLSSRSIDTNEVINYTPEVFKSVYSAIHQTGEQGLSMEEISDIMEMEGVEKAKVAVDTLEAFQLCMEVNAYDSIRIVDSSYRSKYFIDTDTHPHADHEFTTSMKSQVPSHELSRELLLENHDKIRSSKKPSTVNLSDGHKVTILHPPHEPALAQVERQPVEAVPAQVDEVGDDTCPASGGYVLRPILPWINGDGSTNTIVYKGLARRVLGTVMQNPGILEEDIIRRMDVLNPQTCRVLLELMVVDNHITVRMMSQTTMAAPPPILRSLLRPDTQKPDPRFRKHYFANPMSTCLL